MQNVTRLLYAAINFSVHLRAVTLADKATAVFISMDGVATMLEPVPGIKRGDGVHGLLDTRVESLPGACLDGPQGGFELTQTQLHRRQIGRVGGQIEQPHPAAGQGLLHPPALWADRLSMTTRSPGTKVGPNTRFTYVRNTSASVAPLTVITAWRPSTPRVPSRVIFSPSWQGTRPMTRSPGDARPYIRLLARFTADSSMNFTRRRSSGAIRSQ
jgi:hypothetical protein